MAAVQAAENHGHLTWYLRWWIYNGGKAIVVQRKKEIQKSRTVRVTVSDPSRKVNHLGNRLWNLTFQCTSLFGLTIIHLQESAESKTACMKHNYGTLCNTIYTRTNYKDLTYQEDVGRTNTTYVQEELTQHMCISLNMPDTAWNIMT